MCCPPGNDPLCSIRTCVHVSKPVGRQSAQRCVKAGSAQAVEAAIRDLEPVSPAVAHAFALATGTEAELLVVFAPGLRPLNSRIEELSTGLLPDGVS